MRKTPRVVFHNGKYIPESEAKISIYDSALMFGDMVFEMTRSFNKKQFMLDAHLDRLLAGTKILEINLSYTKEELITICNEVQRRNDEVFDELDEHRLMINVSRGPLGLYSGKVENLPAEPTLMIADFPLRWTLQGMHILMNEGINMCLPSQRSIPAHLMDPKIKNRSRIWYQMANIQVSKLAGQNNWAVMIDSDGYITEGTGCNFFIIKNGSIYTPEGRNILRGTRRAYIFELARELQIPCYEQNIEPYDVSTCDEAFVTATPFCILPVTSFQFIKIDSGQMGPITSMLLDKWSANVGVDIRQQILDFNADSSAENITTTAATPYKFK